MQYTVETLLLDANVLRDSILVRMELIHFECYIHVNALMWRLVYRELRALTNDSTLNLNPLELNDLYDYLWDVGILLRSEEALDILQDAWRPWPGVKEGKRNPYSVTTSDVVSRLHFCLVYSIRNPTQNPKNRGTSMMYMTGIKHETWTSCEALVLGKT
jgi:hypothetical protein